MYSTCLVCNRDLGRNEAIEEFPVGRRLAFDSAKGRLWVVCPHCERWNLTPLEERWEAVEACERAFRGTRLRASTDQIGLARLREGLTLVRIGAPLRPELAAWRYGDQFGRRRRRTVLLAGAVTVAVGGLVTSMPELGAGAVAVPALFHLGNLARLLLPRAIVSTSIDRHDEKLVIRLDDLRKTTIRCVAEGDEWRWSIAIPHLSVLGRAGDRTSTIVHGDDAMRAARKLLPHINRSGAGARRIRSAVEYMETRGDPDALYRHVARTYTPDGAGGDGTHVPISMLPHDVRLALEMGANEEVERRALEGELHLLESAWREAEEVAAIADDMFLPASVDEELTRLKRGER